MIWIDWQSMDISNWFECHRYVILFGLNKEKQIEIWTVGLTKNRWTLMGNVNKVGFDGKRHAACHANNDSK